MPQLWGAGNNGGATAFGMFADLKLPTAADGLGNNKVEGGVTFPIAYELGDGWAGAAMTSIQAYCTDRGCRPVWLNTITFAHAIGRDVGGFLEVTSSAGDGSHQATFNCGLTYRTGANTQFDCGLNIGISKAAPDLMVFVGLSRRY